MQNPFRPSFGTTPLILAGRADMIAAFGEAIDDGPGAPGRATLYTGARGTGKTVMLNEVGTEAAQRGWIVIHETATEGFVTRLVGQHLPHLLAAHDPKAKRTKLKGGNLVGVGGLNWDTVDKHVISVGLRNQLEQLCKLLRAKRTGLLITLDEIHHRQVDELRDFFTTLQHLIREDHEIAFAAAGLPSEVSDLLNDSVLTFLRRAERQVLGAVGYGEVERTMRETVESSGRTIDPRALTLAAKATGGYPFLIQLVGYQIWRRSPQVTEIGTTDVEQGVTDALRRMGSQVHEPALAELSAIDRTYLIAMAQDEGPSSTGDIADRLGVTASYAGVYRRRLLDAQMIESHGYGRVTFALPYMREFIREHVVTEAPLRRAQPPDPPLQRAVPEPSYPTRGSTQPEYQGADDTQRGQTPLRRVSPEIVEI